jgi:hypothetical protein
MKCLEERPAAVNDNRIKVLRVHGGYVVDVEGMTKGDRYYKEQRLVAKSIHEVLVFVKAWASPAKIQKEENDD